MKLFQLVERTIRTPNNLVEDITRISLYSLYEYHARSGSEEDITDLKETFEGITGIDVDILKLELEGRFKRSLSASGDYKALTALNIEDIPYYHSSSLVRDHLDSLSSEDIAIVVNVMVREQGNSSYHPQDNSLTINVFELSAAILEYWFRDDSETKKKALNEINSIKSVIDHEVQHLVQHLALPKEQSSIKKNYGSGDRTDDEVHNDYFTSSAEIRPQLANIESHFRTAIADDEFWSLFSLNQKKEIFKMYVGLSASPFTIEIGGIDVKISIPPKPYFKALKSDTPKLHKRVVKDFYTMLNDLMT